MGTKGLKRWLQRRYYAGSIASLAESDQSKLHAKLAAVNKSRKGFSKIFCIGFNKTGTTSLEAVLRELGFSLPDQRVQEDLLSHVMASGRYDILEKFVCDYDAFQDVPFSQENLYITLDALFPRSKFILTVRDPERWYQSLVRFHQKVFGFESIEEASNPDFWLSGKRNTYHFERQKRFVTRVVDGSVVVDWSLLYDKDYCIDVYTSRNDQIIRHFRERPGDLLCLDVSKEPDTGRICAFLEMDETRKGPFPRLNAS